ncbi:hypothetical protein [Streptomyces sp. NPDC001851]|uniref:hypothetical protein n=1 Tax=Streptomyces sp. NPDC001851 TaxID=3154529 RepID=UPI0033336912
MSSIRSVLACTAASVLLSVGGVALAAPAQAQTGVAPQSTTVTVLADDGTGTSSDTGTATSSDTGTGTSSETGTGNDNGNGNGNGNGTNCGLLGLGCLLQGLLGGLLG